MRSLLLLLVVAALSPVAASAQSAEYRSLSLLDGRSLTGEVTESLAEGMMFKSKQGSALVRYDQLAGIEVIDASAARAAMPWQVALAPVAGADDRIALDEWLAQAASGMPGVSWIHGEQWGAEARVCAGVIDCLVAKAKTRSAEYLVAPVYDAQAQRLVLRGVHLAQGAQVGEAGLLVPQAKADAAPALLGGVFTALGMRPDIDLVTASRGTSAVAAASPVEPTPEPVAVTPEPTAEPVAELKTRPTSKPASAGGGQTRVVRRATPRTSFRRSRGAAFALGFAPIPGISSAYVGDPAGVVVSLVGTLSLGALSVYTLGSTVRWKDPFIASSVLVPYALNVLFNQITGQVGWNRLYGNVSVTSKRPVAGIAPLFAADERGPTGATLTVAGRF